MASFDSKVTVCWHNRVVCYFQDDKLLILDTQKHCRSIWSLCVTKEIVRNDVTKRQRKKQTCHQLFLLLLFDIYTKIVKGEFLDLYNGYIHIHMYRTNKKKSI
jgi:hypothetical protein